GTFRLAAEIPEPAVPALLPAPGRRPAGPLPSAEVTP
ncbi:MAG: hypothetical protein QOF98_2065, partial [Streptomyces sp.]|nr:hypothetical protein [Streptomyces sp.]